MQTRGSGVPEASGLAALGGDAFFLVDDERGIFHYAGEGRAQRLDAGGELVDLEGVALAPDGRHLCVLSERDGSVWRFQIDGASLRDGSALGRLPALSKKKNLGWEGIAYAAPGIFGPGLQLAAVHQAKPRRIGVFDPDTLEQHASLRLPKNARTTLGELNDIAVGTDGRILLLSAYSRPSLPLIPAQSCHPFQAKAAIDSRAKLPPWQIASGHLLEPSDAG
jgi:hypothetical protein